MDFMVFKCSMYSACEHYLKKKKKKKEKKKKRKRETNAKRPMCFYDQKAK